jgi:hypothetical protein
MVLSDLKLRILYIDFYFDTAGIFTDDLFIIISKKKIIIHFILLINISLFI